MLNRVVLIGRLTADPSLKYTPSSIAVTTFTLAVDRPFTSGDEKKREADFINIVTWRALAETVANYCRKGKLVAIEGRIQVRNYDNAEGRKVYVTEVIADNVRFLPDGSNNRQEQPEREERSSYGGSREQRDPFIDDSVPIDIDDSDLPF